MGAEYVYNSVQNRKDAVDRLQKSIVWIFGIYSSITFASVLFSNKDEWNKTSLIIFSFSFLFLISAYWLGTMATLSKPESFYGGVATNIQTAFTNAFKKSNLLFTWAVTLCSIGTAIYIAALLLQFSYPFTFEKNKVAASNINNSELLRLASYRNNSELNLIAFQLTTRKGSWNSVVLIHDSSNRNKFSEDTIEIGNIQNKKILFLYSDTNSIVKFNINNVPAFKDHLYLLVTRTDTFNAIHQIVRYNLKYEVK